MAWISLLRSQRRQFLALVLVSLVVLATLLLWNLLSDETSMAILIPVHRDVPIKITIKSSEPVVVEGETLHVSCTATGVTKVYFELPPLSDHLKSSVHTYEHGLGAILVFSQVETGHEAQYMCRAVGLTGREEYGMVDVRVKKVSSSDKLFKRLPHRLTLVTPFNSPNVSGKATTTHFTVPEFNSLEERAEYQRNKVDEFCSRHHLDHLHHVVPIAPPKTDDNAPMDDEVYSFDRHMLLDDKHKILFCFVPKVGCTNLKLLVFVNQGLIKRSELLKARDAVNQVKLEAVMAQHSFMTATKKRKKLAFSKYFKFTMFRNPLERLASSYRSKVERFPLTGLHDARPHFNWLRKDIYSTLHKKEYAEWGEMGGVTPINITFSEFVDYWMYFPIVNKMDSQLDEHFLLINDMCQPCRTRFDFYGNFRHFDRDAQVLMSKIGAKSSDLRTGYYSEDTSTSAMMRRYYGTLSKHQKEEIIKKMALELEFLYAVFPEERDSHKNILNITFDIPLL